MLHEDLARAKEYRQGGRHAEAWEILSVLYAKAPQHPQVNYQLACYHDSLGEEGQAVPYYEQAIALGLPDEDLRGALLGFGSTLRCLGMYTRAADILRQGVQRFPNQQEFPVFLAMTLYNLGQHAEAMQLLLHTVVTVNTTPDAGIANYQQAILFYHDKLDETWS